MAMWETLILNQLWKPASDQRARGEGERQRTVFAYAQCVCVCVFVSTDIRVHS